MVAAGSGYTLTRMARAADSCPQCHRRIVSSRFDASFRLQDGKERLCFGIPAAMCKDCQQLYVSPELIDLLEVRGRCTFAIESDVYMRDQAWATAD